MVDPSAASHGQSLRSPGVVMVVTEMQESVTEAHLCPVTEGLAVPCRQNRLVRETVLIRYGIAVFRRQ